MISRREPEQETKPVFEAFVSSMADQPIGGMATEQAENSQRWVVLRLNANTLKQSVFCYLEAPDARGG